MLIKARREVQGFSAELLFSMWAGSQQVFKTLNSESGLGRAAAPFLCASVSEVTLTPNNLRF